MGARTVVCVIFAFFALSSRAQDPSVYVEVSNRNDTYDEVERRMTSQLIQELNSVKEEALLLYTEYTGKAGADMNSFLNNISSYAEEAVRAVQKRPADFDPLNCRERLAKKLKKVELNAYRAASFSGENHHKFLLGHMIVFRMHLNKTDEYIRRCERALYSCGVSCENNPKVRRWKRLALEELHRVKDDLQHSRRSYKDLVAHAKRKLNHFRKMIYIKTTESIDDYHDCLNGKLRNDWETNF